MRRKDPKRVFTKAERFAILLAANCRCESCGRLLTGKWEAHHKRHHADGGSTILGNGAALCVECHKEMHR